MTRRSMLAALLCLGLICGCSSDKKKKEASDSDKTKLAEAQREVRQTPDKFESSDDPPLTADTHFAAGQLQESQGDMNAAVAQYLQALKISPSHKPALYRLGVVYTSMKRFPDAIAIWRRYLKATNNSATAYNNLAVCYSQAGQRADAEQAFKAGIARDPDDRACRVNYGLMLAREGRMEEAMAQLQTALSPAEVQYNLGAVFEEEGKNEEAKTCYRKALELDPNLKDAKTRLAGLK